MEPANPVNEVHQGTLIDSYVELLRADFDPLNIERMAARKGNKRRLPPHKEAWALRHRLDHLARIAHSGIHPTPGGRRGAMTPLHFMQLYAPPYTAIYEIMRVEAWLSHRVVEGVDRAYTHMELRQHFARMVIASEQRARMKLFTTLEMSPPTEVNVTAARVGEHLIEYSDSPQPKRVDDPANRPLIEFSDAEDFDETPVTAVSGSLEIEWTEE